MKGRESGIEIRQKKAVDEKRGSVRVGNRVKVGILSDTSDSVAATGVARVAGAKLSAVRFCEAQKCEKEGRARA